MAAAEVPASASGASLGHRRSFARAAPPPLLAELPPDEARALWPLHDEFGAAVGPPGADASRRVFVLPESLPVCRFEATLVKAQGGFGLTLAQARDGGPAQLLRAFEEEYAAGIWNAQARAMGAPERQLRPADRIVRANHSSGEADTIFDVFASAAPNDTVHLSLERFPAILVLSLQRRSPQDRVGLLLDRIVPQMETVAPYLRLRDVEKDLTMDFWNRHASRRGLYHLVATAGMDICEVNGVQADTQLMLHELSTSLMIRIVLRRGSGMVIAKT